MIHTWSKCVHTGCIEAQWKRERERHRGKERIPATGHNYIHSSASIPTQISFPPPSLSLSLSEPFMITQRHKSEHSTLNLSPLPPPSRQPYNCPKRVCRHCSLSLSLSLSLSPCVYLCVESRRQNKLERKNKVAEHCNWAISLGILIQFTLKQVWGGHGYYTVAC